MHILLLGSTGRVGSQVLKLAVEDGHDVTVLVRSKERLEVKEGITIVEGDVLNASKLDEAAREADVIVSALSTDKTTTLSESTPLIIDTMKKHNIKRIVTVGTAGILTSKTSKELFRYESPKSKRKTTRAAEEHRSVYEAFLTSNLDWTIVCPTYLPDGEAIGNYRIEENVLPEEGKKISVGDTAHFVYHELLKGEHLQKRVGLAY
ncbi:NAD(P)-dependent oxidoreductase [Guptibacillus algicola]|uniref:NAD(P)-dependent oxidoreductase n=1 Tax=Guptibacillus algicola TaxID=225844 RepID=UPI001CD5DCAC|nr:SDR family oxidoreductase [Alkalihalobacillus algicola]MCA0987687.1 SDR family oxidoreductase [Alkalihalobacillus algicola]